MRALVELARAAGRGPVSAAMIAKQQGLSVAYLEQLLHRLKRGGIVTSVRGPKGGYRLAREAQQITIGEVVRTLDGEVTVHHGKASDNHRHAQRIIHAVYRCVHERLAHALDEVTLQDLCDEAQALSDEPEHRYVFYI
ncbi:MAG: Rrf2 family transcriptional regulator [Candidatus Omnitrophica bacterium]|nr:Rrf2 family transcriptional regulator [Candidatus Omnitrophota bacterium]